MGMRNLLLVHGSGTTRSRLKSYILSELDDITISEVSSSQEAIQKCREQKFELVLCGKELPDLNGLALYKKIQTLPINKEVSFILVTSTNTAENIKELLEQGITHYLVFPFTSKELRDKINSACDPRRWRAYERIHIPDAKAIIHTKYDDIEADIINISINGVACDFIYTSEHANLMGGTRITIKFPAEYNNVQVDNLPCRFLRLNALTWKPDGTPERIHAAWGILGFSIQGKKIMEQIFEESKKGFN
ncbi:MAG TPA: response regulator [Candidatus Wunengus sp. YC64]